MVSLTFIIVLNVGLISGRLIQKSDSSRWNDYYKLSQNNEEKDFKDAITNYRRGRSDPINEIREGEVYSIKSANQNLYLTARSGSGGGPGPVILRPWKNSPAQLWEATKLKPKGFYLKPLYNEFNSITSQIVNNTHSYYPWEFNLLVKWKGSWQISTILENIKKCITANGYGKSVGLSKCDKSSKNQLWSMEIE